jgi:hypothetical protein
MTASRRPWWVPLLGVGSIGLGGLQALGGILMIGVGMQLRPPSSTLLFLAGAAWLLPGAAMLAAGIGVTTGARWGRWAGVGAVAVAALALVPVVLQRRQIAPALADVVEFGKSQPGAARILTPVLSWSRDRQGQDTVTVLREPGVADEFGRLYSGACCLPVLPWYLVVLFACAPPWGRKIAL